MGFIFLGIAIAIIVLIIASNIWSTYKHVWYGEVVEVTQKDIDEGCRGNERNCAIAKALTRKMIELKRYKDPSAEINYSHISFYDSVEGGVRWYSFPIKQLKEDKQISNFITDFDEGKPVKPFSFKLYFPKELNK